MTQSPHTSTESTFNWKAILISAGLIFVLPALYSTLVLSGYGFYIGFQTRGDSELIEAGIQTLNSSLIFQISLYGLMAAVALWQSQVLAKKVGDRAMTHTVIAIAIAVMIHIAFLFL